MRGKSPLRIIGWMRWIVPAMMLIVGLLYAMGDHPALGGQRLEPHVVRGAVLLGLIGPGLAWLALTWAQRAMAAHERARDELEQRRVVERTGELNSAKEELDRLARQLRGLLVETFDIQEQERRRIAQDIHDGVTQLIIGVLYETQAARESLLSNPHRADEKLRAAQELLNRVGQETRRAIYDLRPPILDASGLVSALKEYTQHFQDQTGMTCSFDVDGVPLRLTPEAEVAVYRIAQEALNNAQVHAQARTVHLSLAFQSGALMVTIQDDGHGFDYDAVLREKRGRLGLIGMRERAQSIGGHLQVDTQPGAGTRVIVYVPIASKAPPREEE